MKPLDSLRKNVGRALIQSQFSRVGRDHTHQAKSSGSAQHFLVPHSEQLPAYLVKEVDDLTEGIVGLILDPPERRGTVTHIRELPSDWEAHVNRSILESFVLQLATACEWFIDEVKGDKKPSQLIDEFPTFADGLKELRETRNCLLHSGGVVDKRYLQRVGIAKRAEEGKVLPLDWAYAYGNTVRVLQFGHAASKPAP